MEILVILTLAAIFFAIAMFITSFIMIRKRQVDKAYQKGNDNLYLDDDDDDDDDNMQIFNRDEKIEETETINQENKENADNITLSELEENKEHKTEEIKEVNEEKEELPKIDVIVPINNEIIEEEKQDVDMQEVVNILINKKNYIFLANDNIVKKGEHVKLVLNKKIYFGVITKGNYERDIKLLKSKPRKLVIIKDNKKEEIELLDIDLDILPKKKQK